MGRGGECSSCQCLPRLWKCLVAKIPTMPRDILQPTTFPLDPNDPLAPFHHLIHDFLRRLSPEALVSHSSVNCVGIPNFWVRVRELRSEAAREVLARPFEDQLNCIRASTRFSDWSRFEWGWSFHDKPEETEQQVAFESALFHLCSFILEQPREWSEEELRELLELPFPYSFEKKEVVTDIYENYLQLHSVSVELKPSVETVRGWNARVHLVASYLRLGAALGDELILQSGEAWADDARRFILDLPEEKQIAWREFLLFCFDSDKSKPSAKWLQKARIHIEQIGAEAVEQECASWFVSWGDSKSLELNEAVLKGLVWSASLLEGSETVRALGTLAVSAAQLGEIKHTSHRTRSPSLFGASVWSLSQRSDGLPMLLELKGQIAQKSLRNSLEKAIAVAQSRA